MYLLPQAKLKKKKTAVKKRNILSKLAKYMLLQQRNITIKALTECQFNYRMVI